MPDIIIPVKYSYLAPVMDKGIVFNLYINYNIAHIFKNKYVARKFVVLENIILTRDSLHIIHDDSITVANVYRIIKAQILNEENNTVFFNLWKNALSLKEQKRIDGFPYFNEDDILELEGDINDAAFSSSPLRTVRTPGKI